MSLRDAAVDDIHRRPIGRPWITLAIDVFSRMVAGFYVSFDPPGALAMAGELFQFAAVIEAQKLAMPPVVKVVRKVELVEVARVI